MRFLVLRWMDIIALSRKLAGIISKSGFRPDCIIGLIRGGLIPARLLSDYLDVGRMFAVGISFYTDVGERSEKPLVTQDIDVDLRGKSVLIVDDVADTGMSLIASRDLVISKGAGRVMLATLHKKPWSKVVPDFYVVDTDAWIVYPWEYRETTRSLTRKLEGDISPEERKIIEGVIEEIRRLIEEGF